MDKETMPKQDNSKPQGWFVKHDDLVMGPLTSARIRHLLFEGELELRDHISADKKTWKTINQIPSVVPLQMRAAEGDSDAQAKIAARVIVDARDIKKENRFPMLAITVLLLVVGAVVFFSLRYGVPETIEESVCDAPPAPGINWRNCFIKDLDVGAASLAGANLNSAVLRRAKLSATDLSNADLRYANLSQADLRHAQMQGAAMVGVNLQSADLRGADLRQADLRFADLSKSRIDNIIMENARLDSAIWIDGRSCGANSIGKCEKQ